MLPAMVSRSTAPVMRSRSPPKAKKSLAAAAEVGAPLGADFCAISLSDNLKSWETIERRLRAAAQGDFVIALYNPASRARPYQLGRAFDLLRAIKSPQTIVLFVRSAATPETRVVTTVLAEADSALADMRTLVIIGSAATRLISRGEHRPWVYTPRAEQDVGR
jgi:precorrin-3B C17-methyltransferase